LFNIVVQILFLEATLCEKNKR